MIDGTDISDYTLDGLREQIGFVLQDTILFYGSIRDNITYGRPGATDEEIIEAAKMANADEFIAKMPHGYDTFGGGKGELHFQAASGNVSELPVQWYVIHQFLFLMNQQLRLTLNRKVVMEALGEINE